MLVHGIDSNNNVIPLLLDASGNVIVSASQLPETTYDSILTTLTNTALPAGASNQLDSAVPASQAYLWKAVGFSYTGTVATVQIRVVVVRSGTIYLIANQATIASGQFYTFNFDIPLKAGDEAGIRIINATLNDDCSAYFAYRRIQ